jgi:hypothetical protein
MSVRKTKLTRGKTISEDVGFEILDIKLHNPDIDPIDIRKLLILKGFNTRSLPKERGIANYIYSHRSQLKIMTEGPELQPWSLAALEPHDLPPDIIPILLELQMQRISKKQITLTIRDVRWVLRVYSSILSLNKNEDTINFMSHPWIDYLDNWVRIYTLHENNKLSTLPLDIQLYKSRGNWDQLPLLEQGEIEALNRQGIKMIVQEGKR